LNFYRFDLAGQRLDDLIDIRLREFIAVPIAQLGDETKRDDGVSGAPFRRFDEFLTLSEIIGHELIFIRDIKHVFLLQFDSSLKMVLGRFTEISGL
jgi:hypothetical protein